jgi:hypothetical protein
MSRVHAELPCVGGDWTFADDGGFLQSYHGCNERHRSYPPDLRPRLDPALSYLTISGTSMASPHVAGAVALCIASGSCAGLSPAEIIAKFVADARAYNESRKGRGYGFLGDPLRPIAGEYYGYLIRASLY